MRLIVIVALVFTIIWSYLPVLLVYLVPRAISNWTPDQVEIIRSCSAKYTQQRLEIPHIIHQSWKSENVPTKLKKWQESWKKIHPAWNYTLWTDEQNLKLVTDHFPWFLEKYNGFLRNIERADVARYMYMHRFGGFYADLDVECLADHEPLANCGGLIVPLLSNDYQFMHNIPNAWMASVPGHPFWTFLLVSILEDKRWHVFPEASTGPIRLGEALQEYKKIITDISVYGSIKYVAPGLIFPYDWHDGKGLHNFCSTQEKNFDEYKCKSMLKSSESYSITYWSHTWDDKKSLNSLDLGAKQRLDTAV